METNSWFRSVLAGSRLLLALVTLLGSLSAVATPRERQVTERLLSEGYPFSQATIDGLLQIIEKGQLPDQEYNPYFILEFFAPYSEETGLKILSLVHRSIVSGNSKVEVKRLLLAGVWDNTLRTESYIRKLREILDLLGPSEEKRLVAVILTRFASEKENAIECLHSMLSQFAGNPTLQILTAFNLLEHGAFVLQAENVLIGHLEGRTNAEIVYSRARGSSAALISDRLFEEIKKSMPNLGYTRTQTEIGIDAIQLKREELRTSVRNRVAQVPCEAHVNPNILVFKKREK